MPEKDACTSLQTLKAWIAGELRVIDERLAAMRIADGLLREQNKVHFESLNNEGRRITAVIDRTVSADTWNGFIKQYEERHTKLERAANSAMSKDDFTIFMSRYDERHRLLEAGLAGALPKKEFEIYQKTTSTELNLRTGQTQGISSVGNVVLGVFVIINSMVAVIALILAIKH